MTKTTQSTNADNTRGAMSQGKIGLVRETPSTSLPVVAQKHKSALRSRAAGSGQRATAATSNTEQAQVNFNSKTKLYLVEMLDEYTDAEYSGAFLTDSDHRAIQQDIVTTLQIIRQNNGLVPTEQATAMSSRGLEGMTNHAAMNQRRQAKANVTHAVLNEQDRQGDSDCFNDERMARAASAQSQQNRNDALARGALDAAEADDLQGILDHALDISS